MAEQDFKEKDSAKSKSNYIEVGRSGTLITSDVVQNDYIDELNGVTGQDMWAKMLLSDSQIRKLYHAVCNPIKSADWDIEPASDDTKDIEAAALIKHIIFHDLPGGWVSKLDEILTFPWHGHSVFEVIHLNRQDKEFGPYTGLANLAYRDQRTLDKWIHNRETGILEKIHQIQSGDIEVDKDLPAENLLIFYNEKKGNDNGYPFCRMLYGNYKRKLLYKQLQAIGIERAAIPVPHLELPASVDFNSVEYADAVSQLAAFTQAEQAFFVTPEGYKLNYNQTGTFDPAKVQVAIKAENEEIVGSLVAMWLEMGIGGNSAVGSSTGISADFFKDGIEYLAGKIATAINLYIIPNLIELNFGDSLEALPKLVHSGIADEVGKELMEVVTGYTKEGLITADEPLEDFLRKIHNLPAKAQGEMISNQESTDETSDNSDPTDSSNTDGVSPVEPQAAESKDETNLELSEKSGPKNPKALIDAQAPKLSKDIASVLSFASAKYINDVMARYRQLPPARKQKATDKTTMAGLGGLKKDIKRTLTETATLALEMARKEVPSAKDVTLSSKESELVRLVDKYGEYSDVKLNEASKFPAHIQVLISKQSDLIAESSVNEMKKRLDFSYSSAQVNTGDADIIRQAMEDEAAKYVDSANIATAGVNASSLLVNESRDAFFFAPEVLDEIHSFTFTNEDPKSDICRELAGTTFSTNDAGSLLFSPPLHHNCKSYLRANLKSSRGVDELDVSILAPSAKAQKGITL